MSISLAASLVVALGAHLAVRSSERRTATGPQAKYAAARVDRMPHDCWATSAELPRAACVFGDSSSPTTIVLLGDSHAEHWLAALDRAGREHGWRVIVMVKGGCPVADMPETNALRRRGHYATCSRFCDATIREVLAMRPHAVILAS